MKITMKNKSSKHLILRYIGVALIVIPLILYKFIKNKADKPVLTILAILFLLGLPILIYALIKGNYFNK